MTGENRFGLALRSAFLRLEKVLVQGLGRGLVLELGQGLVRELGQELVLAQEDHTEFVLPGHFPT